MRRIQKQLVLDMLELCRQQHREIKAFSSGQKELTAGAVCNMLNECVVYAEQTASFVDQLQGPGSRVSGAVRKYCSILRQNVSDRNFAWKQLNSSLEKAIHEAKAHLTVDKLEIAFFPYQISMADSMESIYFAAKADPQCEAYWVPIPYYDKLPDGSLGEMHDDGGKYPDRFEAVDWRSYKTAERHPDVIFIHNPYDEENHVTSVHPDFYSSKLKEQTDLLVYVEYGIPYWQFRELTAENAFVELPAMKNADICVTYSNEVKNNFKANARIVSGGACSESRLNQKYVALGSAKFDKVLQTNRENSPLPEEWAERIGGRKVLLYNTSLTAFLKSDDKFLERLRENIQTVSARDDIVLWWRPHPLMFPTLKSMRPALLDEYLKIVTDFQVNRKGIYDNSDDMHRAIAWSDGCLTNESSLMFLYLATGKPFTIEAIDKMLPDPYHNEGPRFVYPLDTRIEVMQQAKGANIGNWNCTIWWDMFDDEAKWQNVHFDNFLNRFIHYILYPEAYERAGLYRQLQMQMFHDFVANSDGTAGEKIYQHCKSCILAK